MVVLLCKAYFSELISRCPSRNQFVTLMFLIEFCKLAEQEQFAICRETRGVSLERSCAAGSRGSCGLE